MKYSILNIEDTTVQSYEKRDISSNYIEYTLNYDDIHTFEGFVFEFLAMKFYGKRLLWYKIYDINPNLFPDELEEGMKIKIPLISSSGLDQKIMSYKRQGMEVL